MLKTPVALLMFNRPLLTRRVLAAIRAAQPQRLLVVADGPRPWRPEDRESCAAARAVIDTIDWDCEVSTEYADANLGCKRRLASGISWVFEQVDEAIILEDDCVPHPTFFRFCEELLDRYRDDERVMHIAGSIYRRAPIPTEYSYVFSRFNSAWGWATWKRAWQYFDENVPLWPQLCETSWLRDLVGDPRAVAYWSREFDTAYQRTISTWDHQWTFACWANSGLSVAPRVNLVSNLGCGPDATHTFDPADPVANVPSTALSFPLLHPPTVLHSAEWDREFLRTVILPRLNQRPPSVLRRAASRMAPELLKRGYRRLASARAPQVAQ